MSAAVSYERVRDQLERLKLEAALGASIRGYSVGARLVLDGGPGGDRCGWLS